jgi:hypothetical protein
MGLSLFSSIHINGSKRMSNGAGTSHAETGTAARLTSFIMAWLLAIFFCLAFWYVIYLLIRSFISPASWKMW